MKKFYPGEIFRGRRLSWQEALRKNLLRILPGQLPYRNSSASMAPPVGLCLVDANVSGGQWAYVDEAGNVVAAPDFNNHPLFNGPQDELIDGQHMVRFPAAWIQRRVNFAGPHVGKEVWFAHHGPRPGYELHNAFWWGGLPRSKFWLGKYQGSLDNDGRLCSTPGALPAVSITIGGFDTAACLRNESCPQGGFVQQNFWMWSWLQYLTLLRYATMDVQTAIAPGVTSGVVATDHPVNMAANVFGVTGAWGNIWQCLAGFGTSNAVVYLFDKHQKMVVSAYTPPDTSGAVMQWKSLDNAEPHAFFAKTVGSASPYIAPDQYRYSNLTNRHMMAGGSWQAGPGLQGLWAQNTTEIVTWPRADKGSRLAKVVA